MKNKKMISVLLASSLILSQVNTAIASASDMDSADYVAGYNETEETEKITDLEQIYTKIYEEFYDDNAYVDYESNCVVYKYCNTYWTDIIKSFCEENGIDANYVRIVPDLETISQCLKGYIRSTNGSVTIDENEGIVVFQSPREDDITNAKAYCEREEIDVNFIKFVLMEKETDIDTEDTEKITDLEQIREMLSQFIEENNLDANVVSNKEYPGYEPIVVEFNIGKGANITISEYAQGNNIDISKIGFVPIVDGVAMTTVNPDNGTTNNTTTTTTVENNTTEELPQTGMPYARAVEGIAALLTLGGAALMIKSRKENDET